MIIIALILPLCLVVAIVHSATREDTPREIFEASLRFFLKLVVGLLLIGAVLYVLTQYL
jgi:ATP/ADP translocase